MHPPRGSRVALTLWVAAAVSGCGATEVDRDGSPPSEPVTTTTVTAPATTTTTAIPPPIRGVGVAGDSVALSLLPSLRAAFGALDPRVPEPDVSLLAALGFGFSADVPGWRLDGVRAPRPSTWVGWQDRARRVLLAERPDAVVVLGGSWDGIEREIDGVRTPPGGPGWSPWYEARVLDALDVYASTGARVVWLLIPACTGDDRRDRGLEQVRAAMRRALDARPGVPVVDLAPLACSDGPRGAPVLEPDGVHFAHEGAVDVVAPWLVRRLRAALGLAR